MSLLNLFQANFLPQRAIGPFEATVTLEEAGADNLEITQHPIQQGASITDHAFLQPARLTLKVLFDASTAPLSETYDKFRALQASRVPMTVVTGKRSYRNMLIRLLAQTTDPTTERALSLTLELQEVILTAIQVVNVPPRARQALPQVTSATENAGTVYPEQQGGPVPIVSDEVTTPTTTPTATTAATPAPAPTTEETGTGTGKEKARRRSALSALFGSREGDS